MNRRSRLPVRAQRSCTGIDPVAQDPIDLPHARTIITGQEMPL